MPPTTITSQATADRALLGGPRARRVFAPHQPPPPTQPMLPWHAAPKVIANADVIEPGIRQHATAITVIAIETLSGLRPLPQLERHFAPPLFYLMSHLRGSRQAFGVRIHSIRLQAPEPTVIEVSAHLCREKQSYAAALRLVRQRAGWICTRFEIALRPDKIMRASAGDSEAEAQ